MRITYTRTPPPTRGDMPDGNGIEKGFDKMWASLEPKLDISKEGVQDAVKTLVVGHINALEKRIDEKIDDAKSEVKDVKEAVVRIEQLLAKSVSVPSIGSVTLPPPTPPPPSYAAAASSQVGAPFPGPVAFPQPRPINIFQTSLILPIKCYSVFFLRRKIYMYIPHILLHIFIFVIYSLYL